MPNLKASKSKPVDDWQAHDDMRTLLRAHQIKSDPKRHSAAKLAAKKRLEEQQTETAHMKRLANSAD